GAQTARVRGVLTGHPHQSLADLGPPASDPPPQGQGKRYPNRGGRRASDTNALRDGDGPGPPPERVEARGCTHKSAFYRRAWSMSASLQKRPSFVLCSERRFVPKAD